MFIDSQFTWNYDSQMTEKYFAEYTGIEVKYRMNKRQMQSKEGKVDSSKALDASLVVTECIAIELENSNSEHAFNKSVNESSGTESGKQDTSSSSGNYLTHAVDADIRPVNDQVPFVEVDSNTTPDSINMSHRGGEIDHDAEQYQVKSPLLNAELFKTKEMIEKKTYNELTQINVLKAQLQAKTTLICNLKNQIKSVKEAKVNSRAKVQSPKTRNNNKLVEPKSHTQKPSRQIAIGQRFSPKKSSAVHEKPHTPRSCLRWKSMGRIFKIAGLRWIPTGKMFTNNTTKVDSEPPNGSNDDITNPYECDQTLNVSASPTNLSAVQASDLNVIKMTFEQIGSSLVLQSLMTPRSLKEKKSVRFSALYLQKKRNLLVFDHSYQHDSCLFHARSVINSRLVPQPPSPTPNVPPTKNDWDSLLFPMIDEYFNPSPSVAQPVLEADVQDTPSTSISQTIKEAQSHVIPTSVEEDDHELHEFEQLEIWKLVPRPDQVMIFTLKWIYKVKLDELGGVLKNKANQGAKGK
ncbi:hypothetical protein Tco_0169728 [Tanacetum coccineum]